LRDLGFGLLIFLLIVGWWVWTQPQRAPHHPGTKTTAGRKGTGGELTHLQDTLPPQLRAPLPGSPPPMFDQANAFKTAPPALPDPPLSSPLAAIAHPSWPLQTIQITGTQNLDRAEVAAVLPFAVGDAMRDINLAAAATKVQSLPWVKRVSVRRDWTHQQIQIVVEERKPVALLQVQDLSSNSQGVNKAVAKLMDEDGFVLNVPLTAKFRDAILLVGQGTPEQWVQRWRQLDGLLAAQPQLRQQVRSAVSVGGRRWDLQLGDPQSANRLLIKLPEQGAAEALARYAALQSGQGGESLRLASPPVTMVDLRLPDRVVLRGLPLGTPKLPAPKQFDPKTGKPSVPPNKIGQPALYKTPEPHGKAKGREI
jgi:cell division protein FtsQ